MSNVAATMRKWMAGDQDQSPPQPNLRLHEAHYHLEWSLAVFLSAPGSEQRVTLLTRDLSLEGMVFRCFSPLEQGSDLDLGLQLPDRRLPGRATVEHCRQRADGGWEGLLRFWMHPLSEAILVRHLDEWGEQVGEGHNTGGAVINSRLCYQA